MRYHKLVAAALVIGTLLALTIIGTARAQDTIEVPRLSMARASASIGVDIEWVPLRLVTQYQPERQFVPVLAAAYKMGENLAAVSSVRAGMTDRQFRYSLGLRFTFFKSGLWTVGR